MSDGNEQHDALSAGEGTPYDGSSVTFGDDQPLAA